jgi:hypothetical protein
MDGRGEHVGRWNGGAVEARVEPDGTWNGRGERGERERRASDGRWIGFGLAFIAVGVGYVGHKVSQSIENVSNSIKTVGESINNASDSIKIVGESINNASAIWDDSKKMRLECRRIKCFEGIRCEFVPNREVLQEKTERR